MPMKNPPQPGRIVRDCPEDLGLSTAEAAKVLNVTRPALHNVLVGRSSVSAEMAFRLAKAFGSTPDFWMRLQTNHDLAQIRLREHEIGVKRYMRAS
jgi:addiction module HigA family antidote